METLAGRIRRELDELGVVAERTSRIWNSIPLDPDDFRVDAVAINLHGLYSGVERVFEQIADRVDGSMPLGSNWHRELLVQMASEIPGTRPPVISSDLFLRLDSLRGFRHVVRNVYTYVLDRRQVQVLIDDMPSTLTMLRGELESFAELLEVLAT